MIREDRDTYYRGPPTFTKEMFNWTDKAYWNFQYNMMFSPPQNL